MEKAGEVDLPNRVKGRMRKSPLFYTLELNATDNGGNC